MGARVRRPSAAAPRHQGNTLKRSYLVVFCVARVQGGVEDDEGPGNQSPGNQSHSGEAVHRPRSIVLVLQDGSKLVPPASMVRAHTRASERVSTHQHTPALLEGLSLLRRGVHPASYL